jgi:hypothetical protein
MSVLLRARVASFLSGAALAGAAGAVMLRRDVVESHAALAAQLDRGAAALEARVARLEAVVGVMHAERGEAAAAAKAAH